MSMFAKAAAFANLSPIERAVLRFLAVVFYGALIAGVQAAGPLLNSSLNPASVPWTSVAHTFVSAFVLALLLGVSKYHTAQGDPPLPGAGVPLPIAAAAAAAASAMSAQAAAPVAAAPVTTGHAAENYAAPPSAGA